MLKLETLVVLAGWGQIALVIGSFAIPKILQWSAKLASLELLLRQVFWTYAGYILVTNLCMGLLSAFAASDLLSGQLLASAVSGYIAVYWIARVLIQFFYFDTSAAPPGWVSKVGEVALVGLFIFLSGVYSAVFLTNLGVL